MQDDLARQLVDAIKSAGVDFITYLPETRLSQILPLVDDDPDIDLIPTASEQEAVTIAAGAALGGKCAAVYMESTGALVSAYSLSVVGRQVGVPLLLIVAHLGGVHDQRNSFLYATIGEHTIPLLEALGIGYTTVVDGTRLESVVADGLRTAVARRSPFALLFAGEFST